MSVKHVDGIYEASGTTVFSAARNHFAGDLGAVMVIGHNPELVVLLNNLVEAPPTGLNMSYFPSTVSPMWGSMQNISPISSLKAGV